MLQVHWPRDRRGGELNPIDQWKEWKGQDRLSFVVTLDTKDATCLEIVAFGSETPETKTHREK